MRRVNFRWSAVTVDCAQPRLVAEFWATLLGRELSVTQLGGRSLHQRHDYGDGTVLLMADL